MANRLKGNVLITGGLGFIVDSVTGAMLEYPSHVIIKMENEKS